jgi:predicted amidophosphoribosyltransferase
MHFSATLPVRFRQVAHRVGRTLVDGILPPRCLLCGAVVGEPDALCGSCWTAMTFFAPPWCAVCGQA